MAPAYLLLALLLTALAAACAGLPGRDRAPSPLAGGCGVARVAGTTTESMNFEGTARRYRLHIPPAYDGRTPAPLVLNLHGYGSDARDQETYSAMTARSDEAGFITVAVDGAGEPRRWNVARAGDRDQVDDSVFIARLLDRLEATLCIDPDRIYATGMSNGAAMAVRLGCDLEDRIAAVAPVAGVFYPFSCQRKTPLPIVAFHGTGDQIVPFEGGLGGRYDFPSRGVKAAMTDWAYRNGCDRASQPSRIEPDVLVETYGCPPGAEVVLYVVEDGGHTWPGARAEVARFGKTTRTISATDLIWEFFEAHPRKR